LEEERIVSFIRERGAHLYPRKRRKVTVSQEKQSARALMLFNEAE
jgi:hypothetical protein